MMYALESLAVYFKNEYFYSIISDKCLNKDKQYNIVFIEMIKTCLYLSKMQLAMIFAGECCVCKVEYATVNFTEFVYIFLMVPT